MRVISLGVIKLSEVNEVNKVNKINKINVDLAFESTL